MEKVEVSEKSTARGGDCPYSCADGWLPLPNHTGFPFSTFAAERAWLVQGLCAPLPAPTEFVFSAPCFYCNEEAVARDEESEGGMRREEIINLLESLGARQDQHLPDCYLIEEHCYRLLEIGPDTWQVELLF